MSHRRGLPALVPGSTKFSFHASTKNTSFSGLIIFHLSYQSVCSMKAKTSFVFITISPEPRDSSAHSRCSTNSSQSVSFEICFSWCSFCSPRTVIQLQVSWSPPTSAWMCSHLVSSAWQSPALASKPGFVAPPRETISSSLE